MKTLIEMQREAREELEHQRDAHGRFIVSKTTLIKITDSIVEKAFEAGKATH